MQAVVTVPYGQQQLSSAELEAVRNTFKKRVLGNKRRIWPVLEDNRRVGNSLLSAKQLWDRFRRPECAYNEYTDAITLPDNYGVLLMQHEGNRFNDWGRLFKTDAVRLKCAFVGDIGCSSMHAHF